MIFNFFLLSRKTFEASIRLQFGSSTPAARKMDSASSNSDSIEGILRCLLPSLAIPLNYKCRSKILTSRQSILISRICKSHCWYLSTSIFTLVATFRARSLSACRIFLCSIHYRRPPAAGNLSGTKKTHQAGVQTIETISLYGICRDEPLNLTQNI